MNPKFGMWVHLGMPECPIPFRFNLTLTYDLVSRITVAGAYCAYYLKYESQICCVYSSWDGRVVHTIFGHFDFDIDF